MEPAALRKASAISDDIAGIDLDNLDYCILCSEELKNFAMGPCNHKNVCATCVLRLRFILKNLKCTICKQDCNELVIASDPSLTWAQFKKMKVNNLFEDEDDEDVFYTEQRAFNEFRLLRQNVCSMHGCDKNYVFPTF